MTKSEVLKWLQETYQQWEAFLDQIDPERMDQPGVAAHWSMKDLVAHLTGWNRNLVANMRAAQRGEPEPPPPWPAHLESEDEINAWIYESNRERPLRQVMDETHQVFQELFAVVEGLPQDVQIDQVGGQGKVFYLVWLGDKRYPVGEFFDHFYDDHEPDVRAWLAQVEK